MDDVKQDRWTDTPDESPAGDEARPQPATVAKTPAVKDKRCQYCHQAFTSSSLGRHLDQYLFKKKPDGIHDVEEIRRIRSSITRRQARTSAKRDSPEHAAGKGQSDPHGVAPLDLNGRPRESTVRMMFNTPTWHATGVINDIPNPSSSQDGTGASRLSTSQSRPGAVGPLDYASRGASANNPETARALELALREVLDNIKAATRIAHHRLTRHMQSSYKTRPRLSPFDIDIQSQTFPALCLQMLPPPPSLFAVHPFPSPTSFPLDPPGVAQVDVVRQALRARIEQWKSEQLASASANQPGSGNSKVGSTIASHDPNMIARTAQQHEEISSRHLDLAFQHWMALPPETRRDSWQLEITRAYARELEKRKQLEEQLARVQQEANQLRAQVEKLGSCQWPREFAIFPPDILPIPRDVARELDAKASLISPGSSRWDYDSVVAKWKRVVMHDKCMGRVGAGYANSVSAEDSSATANARLRGGDDPNNPANRPRPPQSSATAPSPGTPSVAAGPSQQTSQTSPYRPHDASQDSNVGPPAKRQRLMNGNARDTNPVEGENNQSAGNGANDESRSHDETNNRGPSDIGGQPQGASATEDTKNGLSTGSDSSRIPPDSQSYPVQPQVPLQMHAQTEAQRNQDG